MNKNMRAASAEASQHLKLPIIGRSLNEICNCKYDMLDHFGGQYLYDRSFYHFIIISLFYHFITLIFTRPTCLTSTANRSSMLLNNTRFRNLLWSYTISFPCFVIVSLRSFWRKRYSPRTLMEYISEKRYS